MTKKEQIDLLLPFLHINQVDKLNRCYPRGFVVTDYDNVLRLIKATLNLNRDLVDVKDVLTSTISSLESSLQTSELELSQSKHKIVELQAQIANMSSPSVLEDAEVNRRLDLLNAYYCLKSQH